LYIVIGWAAWRHHRWAVVAGILLTLPAIWLELQLAPDVFNPITPGEPGEAFLAAARWVIVGGIVPHVLIALGLVLGIQHFDRPSGDLPPGAA
jgi:uncharacterized membrane protein